MSRQKKGRPIYRLQATHIPGGRGKGAGARISSHAHPTHSGPAPARNRNNSRSSHAHAAIFAPHGDLLKSGRERGMSVSRWRPLPNPGPCAWDERGSGSAGDLAWGAYRGATERPTKSPPHPTHLFWAPGGPPAGQGAVQFTRPRKSPRGRAPGFSSPRRCEWLG